MFFTEKVNDGGIIFVLAPSLFALCVQRLCGGPVIFGVLKGSFDVPGSVSRAVAEHPLMLNTLLITLFQK